LLEREKEGLMRTCAASEETTSKLKQSVHGLSTENAALRERTSELESQLSSLREAVSEQVAGWIAPQPGAAGGAGGHAAAPSAAVRAEVACQTAGEDEGSRMHHQKMERVQQQLSAMSEWLRTGAALLNAQPAGAAMPPMALVAATGAAADEVAEAAAEAEQKAVEGIDEPSSVC
jgi:hypothetical protein